MLTDLRIKNLALVPDLTLELRPGYNAITGETGAGKSILIGALKLVLGDRADRSLIRSGSDSCTVEAVFDVSKLKAPLPSFLDENGLEPCEEGRLTLKRAFTAAGTNRQFVNGSPTSLQVLGVLGEWLVDIHGPHDHQSLLHPNRQLSILDSFGNLHGLREEFAGLVKRLAATEAEKARLVVDEKAYAQQLDLLRYQTNEIKAAKLQPGEEEQVEQQHQRAANAARLMQFCSAAAGVLSEDENAILNQAGLLGRALQELQRIDPEAGVLTELHAQALSVLQDLQAELGKYADQLEIDPVQLQELEERLNLIHSLKKKYGPTLNDVIAYGEEARRKLIELENRDEELIQIKHEQDRLAAELLKVGKELSVQRRKIIPKLAKAVTRELADLGFRQSHFEIALTTDETAVKKLPMGSSGLDTIEFLFAPNPGEPPRPLRAIASSGEMARVMLALKTVLAAEDEIPVLVFDEVDANVGGETAHAVGEKMRRIAANRQVLCITHLAQVAAAASTHFLVTKEVQGGRTFSEIRLLDKKERITELARMLGGQSEAARKHAEALLKHGGE